MQEQMQFDMKEPKKKNYLIILLILLILTTAYLFKTYDVISYFKKKTTTTATSAVNTTAINEPQIREAFLLTRIAAAILQNDRNINAARDLLLLAQDHLNGLQGEQYDNAKNILAADITKLNNAQATDTHSLQEKLATLDQLINILPLRHAASESNVSNGVPKQNANADQESKWPSAINEIVAEAKSIVKIRKKPAADNNYPADVAIDIKRAQFKLLIEQIRWSLFYKEAAVYARSVANAQELLPEVFDSRSESVQKFAATLQELSQANFDTAIPNIQDSVNALQALLVR